MSLKKRNGTRTHKLKKMYNTANNILWKPQRQPNFGSGGTHKQTMAIEVR